MKRSQIPQIVLAAFTVLIINYSCVEHDVGAPIVSCDGVSTISYNNANTNTESVKEIIAENCAISGCHDGSTPLPNWTELTNLQNPDYNKEMQRRITLPLNDGDKMPRVGSITQAEREAIYCWIEQGANDN